MQEQIFSSEGKEILTKNIVPSILTPAITQSRCKHSGDESD